MTLELPAEGLSFQEMSEDRRDQLCRQIERIVTAFPVKEYDTPLQRRAKIENLRMTTLVSCRTPVFAPEKPEEIAIQIKKTIDTIMSKTVACYPDIAGTTVENGIRRLILSRYQNEQRSDMVPTFKVPLPEKEYSELLSSVEQAFAKLDAYKLFAGEAFTPDWDKLDSTARSEYLVKNADDLPSTIFATIENVVLRIQSTYAQHTMDTSYSSFDQTYGLNPKEIEALSELFASASTEEQAIHAKIEQKKMEKRKQEHINRRLMHDLDLTPDVQESIQLEAMMPYEQEPNLATDSTIFAAAEEPGGPAESDEATPSEANEASPAPELFLAEQDIAAVSLNEGNTFDRTIKIGLIGAVTVALLYTLFIIGSRKKTIRKE
jgi:hypothetical protein